MSEQHNTLNEALRYAELGLHVIPIKPGEKRPPMLEWQNHATVDPQLITQWWTQQYAGHGVGIAPRQLPNGQWLFVLDIDEKPEASGSETLQELIDAYGPLPDTPTVHSGSGKGVHYYLTSPFEIRNDQATKIGPGIDIRGNGGQTCAPPTIHETGNQYTWDLEYNLDTTAIAEAPRWLLHMLTPKQPSKTVRNENNGIWDELDDSPAGIYNRQNNWEQLLTEDSWKLDHTDRTGEQHWIRPGKDRGTSATVGYKQLDILRVFTSSLPWLPEGAYSKFKYYAHSHHAGDMSQAAKTIRHNHTPDPNPDIDTPWEPATPLDVTPSAISFPSDTLPEWITKHTKQTSQNIQTPEDLTNILALSALSVATLGNTKIEYPRQNWIQPLNLYTVTALPPSTGKSPAKSAIFAPLEEHEQTTIQQATENRLFYEQEKRIIEGRRKHNEDKAIRGNGQESQIAMSEAAKANLELARLKPPGAGQLILDDTTAEALGVALQNNNGSIAIISAEGGIFDKLAGLYSDNGATNIDLYLEAWSGGRYTVNRIKREPIHIPSANLAIATTIQPYTLTQIGANKTFAGRGLLARFLIAYPQSNIGYRDRLRQHKHNPQIVQDYNNTLISIIIRNQQTPTLLTLDGAPSETFAQWDQQLENQLRIGSTYEHLPEFIGKLRANTIRLAGLLHIAWQKQGTSIDQETIDRAIRIAEYFLDHTNHIAHQWAAREGYEHVFRIIDWIKTAHIQSFTVSELHKKFRRQFPKIEDTVPTIELLADNNYIRPMFDGPLEVGVRGKSSPEYLTNPYIYKQTEVIHSNPVDNEVVYHVYANGTTEQQTVEDNELVVYHSRMCTAGGEAEEVVSSIKRGFLTPLSIKENHNSPHPPYTCTHGTQPSESGIDAGHTGQVEAILTLLEDN